MFALAFLKFKRSRYSEPLSVCKPWERGVKEDHIFLVLQGTAQFKHEKGYVEPVLIENAFLNEVSRDGVFVPAQKRCAYLI